MNTYKLKYTRLQNSIFRLICIKAGTGMNQRSIAKALKVSPTAVAKALPALEKENLVTINKNKTMNLNTVELNREKATALKRTENLKQIYGSGLAEYLEDTFPGCTIILFGSYSLGEDTIDSDIDIAIIGSKAKSISLAAFEKLLERTIYIHYYPDINKINKNLKENIMNGITL